VRIKILSNVRKHPRALSADLHAAI
jgi:hypothetical protein